jgi:glutathione S-transferase
VLRECGLDFTLERVDLASGKTETGADFHSVNPNGYVPALVLDDGRLLTEGPAIVQYIADRAPEKQLAPPAGSFERYRLMQWLNFISTELHKTFGALFAPTAPPECKAHVKPLLDDRLAYVAGELAQRPFLLGETFSVADAYLFTNLSWAPYVKVELSAWPALGAYQARIAARPAVVAALKAEGLIPA